MSKNVGTLVSSAIRPVDSLDPIATAYASEIRGGLHTMSSVVDRNNITFERREWGMMCYVVSTNKTYQLTYNYSSTSIMDNNNWVEFSGSGGGGGGTEWVDSVISISSVEPISPANGDRYLLGSSPNGANWTSLQKDLIVQWNSTLSQWDNTIPTEGMSVRVDNEDNSVYKYETYGGLYPFPSGTWNKEKSGQIRDLIASSLNGITYSTTSSPYFSNYTKDMVFLTKFNTTNIGNTVSVSINNLGYVDVKKPSSTGLSNLNPQDIETDVIYTLIYDGTYFQLNKPYSNEDIFSIKYYIEPSDYIMIPPYYQYWVFSDLTVDGQLVNYGQLVIANGGLILGPSGSFANYGAISFVNLSTGGMTSSFNNSSTIQFTQSNTIYGLSVSATVIDGSLTASKLSTNLNGGPTAGYILSVDNVGDFQWIDSVGGLGVVQGITAGMGLSGGGTSSFISIDVNVGNGLSIDSDIVVLGGTLSGDTRISGNDYNLVLDGYDNLIFTSSVFDVVSDFVSLDSTDSIQVLADNDITISAFGQLSFGASFSNVSIGDGRGLVYVSDYSATFVTHSLVDKNYVDSQVLSLGSGTLVGLTAGPGLTGGGTGSFVTLSLELSSNSGLTLSIPGDSGTLQASVDGFSIGINSAGELYSISGASIPNYQLSQPLVTTGDSVYTGITLSFSVSQYSRVEVFVNGHLQSIGDGTTTSVDCYFSSDGGTTAKNLNSLLIGDALYWNQSVSGFDLALTDNVSIIYEK